MAKPDKASRFEGWLGAVCKGTGECRLIAGARTSITATFVKEEQPVRAP